MPRFGVQTSNNIHATHCILLNTEYYQKISSHAQMGRQGAEKQEMKGNMVVVLGGINSNAITALAQVKQK